VVLQVEEAGGLEGMEDLLGRGQLFRGGPVEEGAEVNELEPSMGGDWRDGMAVGAYWYDQVVLLDALERSVGRGNHSTALGLAESFGRALGDSTTNQKQTTS